MPGHGHRPRSASARALMGGVRRPRRYISPVVEVRLRAVRVDLQSNTPVLLLQETDGEKRTLPIFIGPPEAQAHRLRPGGRDDAPTDDPRPHARPAGVARRRDRAGRHHRAAGHHLHRRAPATARHRSFGRLEPALRCRGRRRAHRAARCSSPTSSWTPRASCSPSTAPTARTDALPPDELVGQFREFLDSIKPEDFSLLAAARSHRASGRGPDWPASHGQRRSASSPADRSRSRDERLERVRPGSAYAISDHNARRSSIGVDTVSTPSSATWRTMNG